MRYKWSRLLCLELTLLGAGLAAVIFFAPALGIGSIIDRGSIKIFGLLMGAVISLAGIRLGVLIVRTQSVMYRIETGARYIHRAAAWCLLPLLFFEVFLRAALYAPVLWEVKTNWFGNVPAEGSTVLWGIEGFSLTHYGAMGEIQTPYDRGDNIIFLGDSRTEAHQVPDHEKYVSVAEQILHNRNFELNARNFGKSGLAAADYASWIPLYKTLFHPKIIVIQVTEVDFSESFSPSKDNYFASDANQRLRLLKKQDTSGSLQVSDSKELVLYPMLAYHAVKRLQLMFPYLSASPNMEMETERVDKSNAENTAPVPKSSEITEDIRIQQQLDLILQAADGTPLIFVLTPDRPIISEGGILQSSARYDAFKQLIVETTGSVVVDPLPQFQQLAKEGYLPVGFFNSEKPDRGHLNQYGNEVVGELLANAIEQTLLTSNGNSE